MTFPDVEAVIVPKLGTYLDAQVSGFVPATHIGTRTPINLQDLPMFVGVRAGGGPRTQTQGQPRVDVQVFAPTRAVGLPLAELVDDYLTLEKFDYRIDNMVTQSGPQEVPWADPNVRLWVASYTATCRRRTA